jgi:predicted glycosyltransferase
MNVGIYCQHVLGLGHLFRTLEIVKALAPDNVSLITGGREFDTGSLDHVRQVQLPGLMMDENFDGLYSVDPGLTVDQVKETRKEMLLETIEQESFDALLIELYPFGRRGFRFELVPAIEAVRQNNPNCRVFCSIRDILVEKSDVKKYETRVIKALNSQFDAVLVHADPRIVRLDETFSRMSQIEVPIRYTGFITPMPDVQEVKRITGQLKTEKEDRLIVASAGSGSVGADLLKAVVSSLPFLPDYSNTIVKVFTGPYMPTEEVDELERLARNTPVKDIAIETFCDHFVSMLKAADLSVSMAGYNTSMNLAAAGTPGLVLPFDQNREQRMRCEQLAGFADLTVLGKDDLAPEKLADRMAQTLNRSGTVPERRQLNLDGAGESARWIRKAVNP